MLEELAHAIDEAAWPRALVLALDAWRTARSPALADLIDALSARCPRAPAPRRDQQPTWMARALDYDAVEACALLDVVDQRSTKRTRSWSTVAAQLCADDPIIARSVDTARTSLERMTRDLQWATGLPKHDRNRIERLCALARWPADPRVATVFARWFGHGVTWSQPDHHGLVLEVLAEQLMRLGDTRVVPVVAACIDRPRACTPELRTLQQGLARHIVDTIAAPAPDDPRVEAWARALAPHAPARSTIDERALWEAIAREPDALGPRMVLADYLLERGERRGELIVLQCANDPRSATRAKKLLSEYWNDWLGDLALVLRRDATVFERGTLKVACVGLPGAPSWAYRAVGAHRELATAARIQRAWRIADSDYAAFLDALPDCARVELVLPPTSLDALAAVRLRWPARTVHLEMGDRPDLATFEHVIARICTLFPALERVVFAHWDGSAEHASLLPRLYALPALQQVVVGVGYWTDDENRSAVEELAASMPIVEVRI